MPAPARARGTGATALLAALVTAFSALLVVGAPPSLADAPGNDDLANALGVGLASGGATDLTLTTTEASREPAEPTPCGLITSTVWVAYTPLDTQLLTATTVASDQMDTVLAAHTSETGTYPLTPVACNDDSSGLGRRSRVTFLASVGTTYYLQVGHYGGDPQSGDPGPGDLLLRLSAAAAAPNDDAATPTEITGLSGAQVVDTGSATRSTTDPPRPTLTTRSLWYQWTAPEDGHVRFFADGGDPASPDTFLYAFPIDGPTTMATAIDYNDDLDEENEEYRAEIVFPVDGGTTYRILAGTRAAHGVFTLTWSSPPVGPPPANDRFADATVIDGASGTSTGSSTLDATDEPQDPDLGQLQNGGYSGGYSVWYRWTAPADGVYRFRTDGGGGTVDTVLAVLTGATLPTLAAVVQNDDEAPGVATSSVLLEADGGTTYSVLVDGYYSRPRGAFDLVWEQVQPAATTTALEASTPGAGLVVLDVAVTRDDGDPASGSVAVREGGDLVATLPLDDSGAATTRLRNVPGGEHAYTATFTPDGLLELTSSGSDSVEVVTRPHPLNDDFADAATITGGAGTLGGIDLLGATAQADDPALDDATDGASVWYRWTAPATGSYTFTVASEDTGVDSLVGVLRGTTLDGLALVRGSRDPVGPGAEVTVPALQGRAYYVLVDAVVAGPVSLAWSLAGGTASTTDLAATSTGAYAYRLEADVTDGVAGSVVFLRDGVAVGQEEVTSGGAVLDRTGQRPGTSTFAAEFYPDDTTVRPSESGPRTLQVTAPPPPPNDLFAGAQPITGAASTTPVPGTTYGATPDPGTPLSGLTQHADTTVWYRWVAPANLNGVGGNGSYEFTVLRDATGTDTVMRAFEGTSLATLRTLAENDDLGTGQTRSGVGISAVAGRTYYLAVDSYRIATMGGFTLTWEKVTTSATTATTLAATRSGRTVTLTSTVDDLAATANPSGYVEFFEGSVSRGVVPVTAASNQAVRTLTNVAPGAHTYRAVFVPDDYRLAQSTSPNRAVTVPRTTTRTTLVAPARARAGARPNVTATVRAGTANATGSVRFTVNDRVVGTVVLRNGRATLRLRPLTIGLARVTATYRGTAVLATSTATRSITVSR